MVFFFFFLMIRRPPRSTLDRSSAASDVYKRQSLSRICRLLGITRQAFYQHFWYVSDVSLEQQLVLQRVKAIRSMHPAIGAVSYTHLRAHETVLDLVCRLLLEKKHKNTTYTLTSIRNIKIIITHIYN